MWGVSYGSRVDLAIAYECIEVSHKSALFPNGVPFSTSPLTHLGRIFVPGATGLRVLRIFTSSFIDLAPLFVSCLKWLAKKLLARL
jgi:hypothetical protein